MPVFLVPDRLEAALAIWLMLLRPCLDRLTGTPPAEAAIRGPLTRKIASTVGLTEVALLRRTPAGLEPVAVADLTLSAVAAADAWLAVPPNSEGFAAGATVEAYAL